VPDSPEPMDPWSGSDVDDAAAAAAAFTGYLRALRRHRFVVIAMFVIVFLEIVVLLHLRASQYEAKARVIVTPLPDAVTAYDGLPLVRETAGGQSAIYVATAASELRTSSATKLAARMLHSTAAVVGPAVKVEPVSGQSIVEIRATAQSPAVAAEIANTYTQAALTIRKRTLQPLVAQSLERARKALATLEDPTGTTANSLRLKIATLEGLTSGTDPTLSLLQKASTPTTATGYPRSLSVAIAVASALLIGVLTIILIELLVPQPIKEEDELQRVWPLPILARVPEEPPSFPPVAALAGHPSEFSRDQFRMLRAQLELRTPGASAVAFVSPSQGDGRTSAAVHYALSIEGAHEKAIILDLDVRRPGVAAQLRVPVDEGLEGVLRRQRTVEGAAIPVPTHPTVAVLATRKRGTQESIELVSARAAEIVADARAVADHVIVDMPPLGEVSDGLGAVVAVDHVIVVIRLGRTMQPALVAVRELIERTGATPVGFLVIGSRRPQR